MGGGPDSRAKQERGGQIQSGRDDAGRVTGFTCRRRTGVDGGGFGVGCEQTVGAGVYRRRWCALTALLGGQGWIGLRWRDRHGEAEVTAAAAGVEVRGSAARERNPSGYRGYGTTGGSAKRS